MSNKRILITGGSGFIGSHLSRRLVASGHNLVLLRSSGKSAERLAGLRGKLTEIPLELSDATAVSRLVGELQPDLVYHLASTPFHPPGTPAAAHMQVIVQSTLHLLEAMRQMGGGRLIYTGSVAEYGSGNGLSEEAPLKPSTLLGAAKASASLLVETYGRLYGMDTVLLRLFTPYGPWEHPGRLIPHVIASALAGRPVRLRGGTQQRDFFYVGDLVEAMVAAGETALPAPVTLNLCSGQGRTVREVAALTLKLMGSDVPVETGEAARPDEIYLCSGDGSLARERLGWRASTTIEQGIGATIRWFQENPQWLNCCN